MPLVLTEAEVAAAVSALNSEGVAAAKTAFTACGVQHVGDKSKYCPPVAVKTFDVCNVLLKSGSWRAVRPIAVTRSLRCRQAEVTSSCPSAAMWLCSGGA